MATNPASTTAMVCAARRECNRASPACDNGNLRSLADGIEFHAGPRSEAFILIFFCIAVSVRSFALQQG